MTDDAPSASGPAEGAPTAKRRLRASSAETRLSIILAAEDLFAERGIEAVSLREIAIKSGQGNNNAVQYHFESKEALLYEIFRHRLQYLERRRAELLDFARKAGLTQDAKALLSIMCLPQLDLKNQNGRHSYISFLYQYLSRYLPAGMVHPVLNDRENFPATNQLLQLIYERISYIPPEIARYRINLSVEMFLNAVAMYENGRSNVDFRTLVNDTLEVMAEVLCTPARAPDSNFEAMLSA